MFVSPFLIDALLGSPEMEKAQPELTDWARLWFVAEWIPPPIALHQMTLSPPFHWLNLIVAASKLGM